MIVIQFRFVYRGGLSVDYNFMCLPSPLPADRRICHETLALRLQVIVEGIVEPGRFFCVNLTDVHVNFASVN